MIRGFVVAALAWMATATSLEGQDFPGAVGEAAESFGWVSSATVLKVTNTGCDDGSLKAFAVDSSGPRIVVGGTVAGDFSWPTCPGGPFDMNDSLVVLGQTFPEPGVRISGHPGVGGSIMSINASHVLISNITIAGYPCTSFLTTGCGSGAHVITISTGTTDVYLLSLSLTGNQGGGEFISIASNDQDTTGTFTFHNNLMGGSYDVAHTAVLMQSDDVVRADIVPGGPGLTQVTWYRNAVLSGGNRTPYITCGTQSVITGGNREVYFKYWYNQNYSSRPWHFRGECQIDFEYGYVKPGPDSSPGNLFIRWDDNLTQAGDTASIYIAPENVIAGVKTDTTGSMWPFATRQSDGSLLAADTANFQRASALGGPLVAMPTDQTLAEWITDVEVSRSLGNFEKMACGGGLEDGYRSQMDSLLYARAAANTLSFQTDQDDWFGAGNWTWTLPSTSGACVDEDEDGWFDLHEIALVGDTLQGPTDDDDSNGIINLFEGAFEGTTPTPPTPPGDTFTDLRVHLMQIDTVTLSNGITVQAADPDSVPVLTLQTIWPEGDDAAGLALVVTCDTISVGGGFKATLSATQVDSVTTAWARYDTTMIKNVGAC